MKVQIGAIEEVLSPVAFGCYGACCPEVAVHDAGWSGSSSSRRNTSISYWG